MVHSVCLNFRRETDDIILTKADSGQNGRTTQKGVCFTQVVALQARLESLHVAKILSDEELYALEDVIADDAEGALEDGAPGDAKGAISRMVALSGRMAGDAAFGRQLRRKFAP